MWISTKITNQLPQEGQNVFIAQAYEKEPMIACIINGCWIEKCDNLEVRGNAIAKTTIAEVHGEESFLEVTHWAPLISMPRCMSAPCTIEE